MQPAPGADPPAIPRQRRTVTIAVSNQKGGTGKSTTTVNLAHALVERGRTVRAIDADPQKGSTSHWIPPTTAGIGDGLFEVYKGEATLDAITSATSIPGLYMVPSDLKLRAIEKTPGIVDTLKDAIAASTAPIDYNIIDTVPNTSYLAIGSLAASDELVVPLQPSELDRAGVDELIDLIRTVQQYYTPTLRVQVFFVHQVKTNAHLHQELLKHMIGRFPHAAVLTGPPNTVKLQETILVNQPITIYEPRGKAAKSYRLLAQTLEERIHGDAR